MQLYLGFRDISVPEACVWEQLSDQQRGIVIQVLTRLMLNAASATRANRGKENEDDRQQQG